MKRVSFLIASALMITQLQANDSFNSEISHVVGGAVIAGGITAMVDRYYPEYRNDRGMIGFGVSSIAMIVFESVTIAVRGDAKGQLLDIASHITGSAFGAFVSDGYILSPIVHNSPVEGKYVGLALQHSF